MKPGGTTTKAAYTATPTSISPWQYSPCPRPRPSPRHWTSSPRSVRLTRLASHDRGIGRKIQLV